MNSNWKITNLKSSLKLILTICIVMDARFLIISLLPISQNDKIKSIIEFDLLLQIKQQLQIY